jgi:hypothetical protein
MLSAHSFGVQRLLAGRGADGSPQWIVRWSVDGMHHRRVFADRAPAVDFHRFCRHVARLCSTPADPGSSVRALGTSQSAEGSPQRRLAETLPVSDGESWFVRRRVGPGSATEGSSLEIDMPDTVGGAGSRDPEGSY